MTKFTLTPRTFLPTVILVGVMVLSLRLGDIWVSISEGTLFSAVPSVHAETKKVDKKKDSQEVAKAGTKKGKKSIDEKRVVSDQEVKRSRKQTSAESRLYQQLAGRRDQLDKRSNQLDEREALLVVAETRIDQKVKEMQGLRKQLEALLGQASGAQQQQLTNLVKMYESMKPKDAAKIFEALEMPVLLVVVQRMKPKISAKVLAAMNPELAQEITVRLTKRDQLPQLK